MRPAASLTGWLTALESRVTDLQRHLTAMLAQTGRRYPALEQALPSLPSEVQRDLLRLLREQQADHAALKRKARWGMMPY